ncbi:pimeloyl-ACP methyl ester carboxylesterase [Streptacidiphilus sp. MAP12-16]|uniref:alpha/beta fold hydrolase n=1 Tax=Streptacidiphilus sp. MAP12-16 TaxID=3156300 RepID=UPI0035140D3D
MSTATSTVTSKDGTEIAFDRLGSGPSVILVDGALCYRASGPMAPLAKDLAAQFTVYTYDRRGRGESGDTKPYSPEREIEDIAALVSEAGGTAALFGASSGAVLALDAAARLDGVSRVAAYEPPFVVDDTHPPRPQDYLDRMDRLVASGQRGAAVKMFLKSVGVPGAALVVMRLLPVWSRLTSVAHTLPYDFRVLGDTGSGKPLPKDRWESVRVPVLVMDGGKSPTWMRNGTRQLAEVLPNSEYRTLPGQTHMVKAEAVGPALVEFLGDSPAK